MNKSKLITVAILLLVVGAVAGLVGYTTHVRNATNKAAIVEVTKDNVQQEVFDSPLPVFVYWYAPNCKPCDVELPLIEQAARDYAGKVKFVKIDAAAQPELAANSGITAAPTLFLLKRKGGTLLFNEGFLTKEELHQFIEAGLAAKK